MPGSGLRMVELRLSPVPFPYRSSLREVGGASPWVAREPDTSTEGVSGGGREWWSEHTYSEHPVANLQRKTYPVGLIALT